MEYFWGFVPRWYVPKVSLYFESFAQPVTITLMIVDDKQENYVSVGYDWPPIRLGRDEIMVQQSVIDYIGVSKGSKVTIPLDFSGLLGD